MILFLTNADTDILLLRTIVEGLPDGFPPVQAANPSALTTAPTLDGVGCVLVRLLGGRQAWEQPFDELRTACVAAGVPLLAFAGEAVPDADLTARSTAPSSVVTSAFAYLAHGGAANLEHFLRFVADRCLGTGFGYDLPAEIPTTGLWGDWVDRATPTWPTVGVVFYRAHVLSGNTLFIDDLCGAIDAAGANPLPAFCYSLRGDVGAVDLLRRHHVDAVITTVLAAGHAGDDGEGWEVPHLTALDVPIVQAIAATTPSAQWGESAAGLSPIDVAMSIAIPEFDGRVITVPFSFKEVVDDGAELGAPITAYRTLPDRAARAAGIATRLARLRHIDPADTRVAIVLSAYPTKRSRLGNAVGLDTPASVIDLLRALRRAGYGVDRIPDDGDALMAELADGFHYDVETLTSAQLDDVAGRWPAHEYEQWFATLPDARRAAVVDRWGDPPGTVWLDARRGELAFPGLDLGHVLVCVQPPRAFGGDLIASYHSPDEPPTHHYLAFYRWLDTGWGADAVVHVGKHGTLEWLPGKGVGSSAACFPDAALGDVPLFYPFVVNDPGEGTQAKRRAHAVVIDHLLPPMTRAETYDDLSRLETLLDEHAQIAALDPAKLPGIRARVWDLLVEAEIHRDLDVATPPDGDAFDDLLLHVDGYLCELKDAQIRGGLHTLGRAPDGAQLVDLVLALTRVQQGRVPPLRRHLPPNASLAEVDAAEAEARAAVENLAAANWRYDGGDVTLRWVCDWLVPRFGQASDEIGHLLHGLDGGFVPSGPSGAPTRGAAHVLPTGRNFYGVDPKGVPSPLAWEVGGKLADQLLARHLDEEGAYPDTVGLVLWGTAAMRTMGDDAAMALALLGVRPQWDDESRRVVGLELISEDELHRPRVDVTLRISGFFRDAFPHVVALLDEAVEVAGVAPDGDPRIFGPKPGGYGSGILPLLESGEWSTDDDLAAVYLQWGGYAYGRGRERFGAPASDAMRRRFAAIDVAVKNQDNREHDIFDSDDYLQDHGGMVATARVLRPDDAPPKAWFGDSSDPSQPRVRSLAEEAARVVRTRVLNPKWLGAMQSHGYKGAFELAATVDYLFGYDATTHVVEDWMYERVTQSYVADPEMRKFFEQSNPWALRQIAERLLEAATRGLWSAPSDEAVTALRAALLEGEGWEESR